MAREPSLHDLSMSTFSLPGSDSSSIAPTPGFASPSSSTTLPSSVHTARKAGNRAYKFATQCATVENPDPAHRDQWGSSSVPIYQTATFKGMGGEYDYSRSGNPTRTFLEHHIAKISSARRAFALTSGMGALDVIFRLLQPGDEIIAGNDLYGGSNRLLTYIKTYGGVIVHHVDTTRIENVAPLLRKADPTKPSRVRMVLLESPTNPLLQIADLGGIASLVHEHVPEALVVVDNTMMSPYLQRPLEHGADIVYDSATKYLSGHHDLMAGAVVCDREDVAKRIAHVINSVGNGLPAFDSFLLLRGIKTLALRFDQQQSSARLVAAFLDRLGFRVHFPGLPNAPGREVHERQAAGPGAVLSFETGDKELSERIVGATRLWGISVSFGCVNSLISMPCLMSHASIDPAVRAERNLPEDLIRLCVGIEDSEDLVDDLEAALLEAGAIRVVEDDAGNQQIVRATGRPVGALATQLQNLALHDPAQPPSSLIVSAPGKVILFGEHAVVHGVTAIAGSVDLRAYCLVEPRADGKLAVNMHDIGVEHVWDLDALPWSRIGAMSITDADASPDRAVVDMLARHFSAGDGKLAAAATQAFLYLYLRLYRRDDATFRSGTSGQTFTIRSALPVSAGLGSSAAFCVSVATALLYTQGHLPLPHHDTPGDVHAGRRAVSGHHAELINSWAFVGEKVIHGTPSGVDNAVATYGGAVVFEKAMPDRPGSLEGLHGFKSLRFLLTDTKVPRDTKTLVAGVAELKAREAELVEALLAEIQAISDEARRTLADSELSRPDQVKITSDLVTRNHALLAKLGVSHPALEAIVAKTSASPYHLSTKLTGAGGGGCAVTLIPDDFSPDALRDLTAELEAAGFNTYETAVGGNGVGLALPQTAQRAATAEGGVEAQIVPGRASLEAASGSELASWAAGAASEWLYS